MAPYGEKGVKWELRILFNNTSVAHFETSTSKAKAMRRAREWLHSLNVKAVELSELRKTVVRTPIGWWDARNQDKPDAN